MLAGQLLIFDLDEEPPNDVGLDKNCKFLLIFFV